MSGQGPTDESYALMAKAMRDVEFMRPGVGASMNLLQKALLARVNGALARARLALHRSRGRRKAVSATVKTYAEEAAAAREAARTALRELKRLEASLKSRQVFDKREDLRRLQFIELAHKFARMVRENKELRALKPASTPVNDETRAILEQELEESRETISSLMRRGVQERRRWKALLLALRKRLRRSTPKMTSRIQAMEQDLEEARDAQANLLVELTKARRDLRARLALASKTRRVPSPAPTPAPAKEHEPEAVAAIPADPSGSLAIAREAYSEALADRLARLGAPRAGAEEREKASADATRLARCLRLAAEAAASLPARANAAVMLERRLESWQGAFTARGASLDCAIKPTTRQAIVSPASFRLLLDELLSNAVERLPPGAELSISAGDMPDGSYVIAFSDDGPGFPADWLADPFPREARPGPQRPGLGLSVARDLLRRWGGELTVFAGPGGKGARLTVKLASARA